MLKKILFSVFAFVALSLSSAAQTDSTDLDLYLTDAVLETALDSMLYSGEDFQQLNLDFTITDTVTFNKVHVELKEAGAEHVIFKHVYALTELEAAALISAWNVSIPFGNLENTTSYTVAIVIESYDGSLSATITKTL